jgi:phospholipid/cholesterol/gamma-HCH transport system substrate-binding protein
MKTDAGQKIKIGVFTIVGILLFVGGIFIIGSKKNMFGNTFMVYGTFSNVGGLGVGNNIRYAGINVGTVQDIRIISDTSIRVDMLMKNDIKPFIKADAVASIGSDGLMGDKLITISPGSSNDNKLLTPGSEIKTLNPIDFDKVIGQFTNAEIITGELADMAIQIREGNGTISKLLYTDDLSVSLEKTADNAATITNSLADIATHIRSGRGSVGSLIYTDSLSNTLETAGNTANAAMLTIQEGAHNFNENMKALQSSFLFRGYFKRRSGDVGDDMDEAELKAIIAEAQKALDEKKKKK